MKNDTRSGAGRIWSKHIAAVIAVIVLFGIGAVYILNTWKTYLSKTEEQALALAEAAEAFLCMECFHSLDADTSEEEYPHIKDSLMRLTQYNQNITAAYLYTVKNEKANFVAAYGKSLTTNDQTIGKHLPETDIYNSALLNGEPVVSETKNQWGKYMTVLVPVVSRQTGNVLAVLGMDYHLAYWLSEPIKHAAHAFIVVLCILFLSTAILLILRKNDKLTQLDKNLKASMELFSAVFEQAPIGIAVGNKYKAYTSVNPMFLKITGRTREELKNISWKELTHPDDLEEDIKYFEKFLAGEIDGYSMRKRYIKPDGSAAWVNMVVAPLNLGEVSEDTHLCLINDISDYVQTGNALRESERSKEVLLSHLPGLAYRCNYDTAWTMLHVSKGCFELTGYEPESLLYNRELSYNDLIAPEYRERIWEEWKRVLAARKDFRFIYEIITASGKRKWVQEMGQGIFNSAGEVEALEGIIIDITDQKKREEQVQYMSEHDAVTGLFNRTYFEKQKQSLDKKSSLPLSVIIGNINSLRLINDAYGHAAGDHVIVETARIIKSCLRKKDVLARTGGDEFSILLPKTDGKTAYKLITKITNLCEEHNKKPGSKYNISVSLGYGVKTGDKTLNDAVKEAEENMHNRKLLNRKSSRSTIISSIMGTVYIRSQETEEHAKRLVDLSVRVGRKLNISQKDMDNLELFAMLHDIGKIGIDNSILNKPGKLSKNEWEIMKKHSEIGYRIAMSSPELEPIAEYILAHHERWDGNGYPQGLKGEEIPLLSRILAVVDSYDAMTEDRVYRKAMTHQAAIEEIKKNAGTQFDPNIAQIFIDSL
ncbi:MAG: PAS domain S-box protein [Bacillota bacterium]|jgi:diguanylate cyclase (GGDEF)-like protein/PAS domain S-box-containing protein|nr:PAS domain S-box protein [Bacillota bacterium]NLV61960.1 PAS domain S-box protein [Clostridiaceae bacterium]